MPIKVAINFLVSSSGWLHGCRAWINTNVVSVVPGVLSSDWGRGTFLPHIAEHVCLELQGLMGFAVSFGRARNAGARTLYHVLIEYSEEQPARAALEAALRLALAAMHGDPFDVAGEIEKLRDLADDYKLGPSTGATSRRPGAERSRSSGLLPHDRWFSSATAGIRNASVHRKHLSRAPSR
jgi:hypothetical protein